MQRLKSTNIIEVFPGRGTFVSKNNSADTNPGNTFYLNKYIYSDDKKTQIKFIEFRRIIEIGSVDLMIRNIRENDFKKLKSVLKVTKKA